MRTRRRWEREHSTELDRLDVLDHQIDVGHRLEQAVSRQTERRQERDVGIEL